MKKFPDNDSSRHEGLWQAVKAFSVLSGVGIYLAVVLAICIYLGSLADEYFALDGKGKLLGILLGFPIAFYTLYRQLKHGGAI